MELKPRLHPGSLIQLQLYICQKERERKKEERKKEREKEREIIHQPRRFHPSGGMRQEGEKKGKGIEKNTARLPAMLSKNAENFQPDEISYYELLFSCYYINLWPASCQPV